MNSLSSVFTNIPFLILCIYILLLFGISIYAKKRSEGSATNFLLAGRKLGTFLVTVSVAGLAIGAASTVGVAESSYKMGISAGWYNGAWAAGALVMGLVGAAKYRKLGVSTLPELFERHFGRESRLISAIALLIVLMMIASLQYIAGGAILSTMLPDIFSFRDGMFVSAIVFIAISLIGGLWSSGLSNIVSVALIYFGVIAATIVTVSGVGGFSGLASKLPAGQPWFSLKGTFPIATLIGWFVVMITQALTAQGTVQIACSAKDEKSARNGYIGAAIVIFPIGFLCAIMGMVARVQFPDVAPTLALPHVIMSLPPLLAGLILSALWAADVSTACTILMGSSTLFTQDIYKRFVEPQASEKKIFQISRLSVLLIGLFTLYLAFQAEEIVKTMMIGLSLTTAFTLIFLMLLFKPTWCRQGSAFWTNLVGIIGLAAWQLVPAVPAFFKTYLPFFTHPIYLEWFICGIAFFLVALLDKRPILSPERLEEDHSSEMMA